MRHTSGEYFRDLLLVLIQKEIKARYKNTWLGYLWSVGNPLIFAAIYYVAFGIVMQVQVPNYPLYLMAGLFTWHWVVHSLNAAPNIFLANATLLKKVAFPANFLVAATVINDGIHFVLTIPVVAGVMLANAIFPTYMWLLDVPLLLASQFFTVYGFALVLASLNLFFRDLDRLINILLTALFFLTPVAYSISMIPPQFQGFMYLNPFTPLITGWQQLFLSGAVGWDCVGLACAYAGGLFFLGSYVYGKLSRQFAEVL